MTFPLFQFLSPAPAPANPNGGVANGMAGIQSVTDSLLHKKTLAQQDKQFQQTVGLHVNDQLMRGQQIADSENQDAAGMVMRYNQFLANGDDASAQSLAPAMKQMGIDLVPRPGAPGMSPQDWQTQAVQTPQASPPDVVSGAQPDVATPEPAKPTPKSNVPPLLSKFMTAAPKEALPAEAPVDEQAASAERVRSIGGTPLGPAQEAPVSPGSAQVEAAANPDLSVGKPQMPSYEVMYRGKSMGVIDPNLFHSQHKGEATRRGQAFVDSLPKDAANQFFPGLNDADTGEEQKDAIKNDMAIMLQGMRSAASHGKGGGGGAGTGLEGVLADPKEAARLDGEVRQWTQAIAQDNSIKKLNEVASDAAKTATLLNPDEPLANRLAVAQTIKSMFGAAASEGERSFILGGEGMFTKLQMDLNNWVNGGTLPANFKSSLQAISNRAHIAANNRASMLANHGADSIIQNPLVGGRIPVSAQPKVKQAIVTTLSAETGMTEAAPAANKKPSVYSQ